MARASAVIHTEDLGNPRINNKISGSRSSRAARSRTCCACLSVLPTLVWWIYSFIFGALYASLPYALESYVTISPSLRSLRCKNLTIWHWSSTIEVALSNFSPFTSQRDPGFFLAEIPHCHNMHQSCVTINQPSLDSPRKGELHQDKSCPNTLYTIPLFKEYQKWWLSVWVMTVKEWIETQNKWISWTERNWALDDHQQVIHLSVIAKTIARGTTKLWCHTKANIRSS
jgi:hypothetical protein